MEKVKSYPNTQLPDEDIQFKNIPGINSEPSDYNRLKNKPAIPSSYIFQSYSELHGVGTSDGTFTITAGFQPKIVKVSAYAVDNDERSSSIGTQIGALTNTLISYFKPGTSGNSSTSTSDIIYLTLGGSQLSYTCTINPTGATFTIGASGFSGGNAIIEMYL